MAIKPTSLRLGSPLPDGSLDLAERPIRLRGLRIGLLDSGAALSAGVLRRIALRLRRDHAAREIRFWRKRSTATGAPLLEELAQTCDAAICGVGLCTDTVSSSVGTAIELEKLGIPTVTLIGEPFCLIGRAMAQKRDFPALPVVMLTPPADVGEAPDSAASEFDAAGETARLLTAPRAIVVQEFLTKLFPPPAFAARAIRTV